MTTYQISIDGLELPFKAQDSESAVNLAWENYPCAKIIKVIDGGQEAAHKLDASAKVGEPNRQVYNPDSYKANKFNSTNRFKN